MRSEIPAAAAFPTTDSQGAAFRTKLLSKIPTRAFLPLLVKVQAASAILSRYRRPLRIVNFMYIRHLAEFVSQFHISNASTRRKPANL